MLSQAKAKPPLNGAFVQTPLSLSLTVSLHLLFQTNSYNLVMDDYIRTQTECGVCLAVIKQPQILSCLHTFCRVCVQGVMKNKQITCPYCKAVTIEKDVKDDFKTKELLQIRLKDKPAAAAFTAKQQVDNHLQNLQLLKEQYLDRVKKIDGLNKLAQTQMLEQLRANKRKWTSALDFICARAETIINESVQNNDVIKRAKLTIADIDAKASEVKDSASDDSRASVDAVERFTLQLAELVKNLPPEAHSLQCDITPHTEFTATLSHAAGLLFDGQLVFRLHRKESPASTSLQPVARSSGDDGVRSLGSPPPTAQTATPPADTANRETIIIRACNPLRQCQLSQSRTVITQNHAGPYVSSNLDESTLARILSQAIRRSQNHQQRPSMSPQVVEIE